LYSLRPTKDVGLIILQKKTPYSISPEGKCPPTSALSHFRPTVTSPPFPAPPDLLPAPPLLRRVRRPIRPSLSLSSSLTDAAVEIKRK
jgi:hypothetical protein